MSTDEVEEIDGSEDEDQNDESVVIEEMDSAELRCGITLNDDSETE